MTLDGNSTIEDIITHNEHFSECKTCHRNASKMQCSVELVPCVAQLMFKTYSSSLIVAS